MAKNPDLEALQNQMASAMAALAVALARTLSELSRESRREPTEVVVEFQRQVDHQLRLLRRAPDSEGAQEILAFAHSALFDPSRLEQPPDD